VKHNNKDTGRGEVTNYEDATAVDSKARGENTLLYSTVRDSGTAKRLSGIIVTGRRATPQERPELFQTIFGIFAIHGDRCSGGRMASLFSSVS
jgi:hypothetical protein